MPVENVLEGDELRTDVPALAARLAEVGASNVLCVLSTTSCFAPRGIEKLLEVARLCAAADVPHLANNAYGVQCAVCMKAIATASRHARLDAFVQSTDKNFLVPVGGAVVATASREHGPLLLAKLRSTYPGRASLSPVLDLFATLLHLGATGWLKLLEARRALLPTFRSRLSELAARHGERLLATPHNDISMAVSLTPPAGAHPASLLGANLFIRLVSGVRVVVPTAAVKTVAGCDFSSCVPPAACRPCRPTSAAAPFLATMCTRHLPAWLQVRRAQQQLPDNLFLRRVRHRHLRRRYQPLPAEARQSSRGMEICAKVQATTAAAGAFGR
jgi:O-phospho-L-seryl-tRNASec:L-selenocysteinyl-tRNA synthase